MSASSPVVRVNLAERSYDIEIGAGNLARAGSLLPPSTTHVVLIADEKVENPHATGVAQRLVAGGVSVDLLVVESGEQSKGIETAAQLWNEMLEVGADRKTAVVAIGGGVIGDLAGFIAATFTRGLPFVQIPTTLLAQVDSSVGGKVGINLPGAKNMVGAFWQPHAVLIDTKTLDTLPDREYRSGLAEVVKYGVILDAEFFAYLESHVAELKEREPATLAYVIQRCCRLKADVVEGDEREVTGLRAVLNYGHTFGHAFEAVSNYEQWLHGEAVSIGMDCAARLAERLGRVDRTFVDRQCMLLLALGLPVALPALDKDQLIDAMKHDKKVEHGQLRFVLPDRLGHVELVADVDPSHVGAVLAGE